MSSSVVGIHTRPSHSPQIVIKNARLLPPMGTQDLIVMGLDERTTEKDLRFIFRDVSMAEVKCHPGTQICKGYGFIRFNRLNDERQCLLQRTFNVRGRWCTVKRPDSQTSLLPPLGHPASALQLLGAAPFPAAVTAPLPQMAASLPPAASIPPTEAGYSRPFKEKEVPFLFLAFLCFKFSCVNSQLRNKQLSGKLQM